jgi:hypothetical protein
VGGVADGERQADRAGASGSSERVEEEAGGRAMAREGRSSEKGRRDDGDDGDGDKEDRET